MSSSPKNGPHPRRKSVEREASLTVAEVFAFEKNKKQNHKNGGGGTTTTTTPTMRTIASTGDIATTAAGGMIGGGGGKPPKNSSPKKKIAYSTQRTSSSLSSSSGVPSSSNQEQPQETTTTTTASSTTNGLTTIGNTSSPTHPKGTTTNTTNNTNNSNPKKLNRQATSNITFASQHELPRLPIPSLDETLNKFLQHLVAIQNDDDETQRARAQHSVLTFLKGDGPKLQELLLEYDRQGQTLGTLGSYVEEFWNDSYLAPESSVVLNLNPFFVLEDGPDPKTAKNPIRRAASLCFASIKMASQLRNEALKPDTVRGKPLCMDQFKALFSAARVPSCEKDSIALYDKSSHVAVQCRSQMYYFQALWPDGDVAVDEGDLMDILGAIHSHAEGMEDPVAASRNALGVLTSLPRHEWAVARDQLIRHSPLNEESLRIVDSALFVMVLDEYIPQNVHDAASNMLHGSYQIETLDNYTDYQVGSCINRWYDKMQIIVCGDGTAGINFEHSAIDGHTALRFVSDIYAETVISFAQSITKLVQAHDMIPNVIEATVKRAAVTLDHAGRTTLDVFPKKIPFDVPPEVKEKIYYAETALGDQIVASETYVLEFARYGKLFICENKVSPDSYVQMSMMLAYYKLYGKVVCAYEPVLTKGFFHGRTEAMRPATLEAKQLCEIWTKPSSTPSQKEHALRHATQIHSQYVKECARGKGVDRHLFALKGIAEKHGLPVPSFFNQEPWKMLNHTILSTSNCGNPSLRLFGFGPVVPDGLGIGYIIKDHGIQYSISSKHRQTKRYAYTLDSILKEMGQLFKPSSNMQVPPSSGASTSSASHRAGPSSVSRQRDDDTSGSGRRVNTMIPVDHVNHDSYGDVWGEQTPMVPPSIPKSVPSSYPPTNMNNNNNNNNNGGMELPTNAVVTTTQVAVGGESANSQWSAADSATMSGGESDDNDESVDFDTSSAILVVPASIPQGVGPVASEPPQEYTTIVDSLPPPPPPPPPIGTPGGHKSNSSRWDPEMDVNVALVAEGGSNAGGGVSGSTNIPTTIPPSEMKTSLIEDDDDDDDDDEEIVVPITPIAEDTADKVKKDTTDKVSEMPTSSPPKLKRQKSNDSMPKVPARRGSMFTGVKRETSFEYKELAQKGIHLHMAGNRIVPPETAATPVHHEGVTDGRGGAAVVVPPPTTSTGATTYIPFSGSSHSNNNTSVDTAGTNSDVNDKQE